MPSISWVGAYRISTGVAIAGERDGGYLMLVLVHYVTRCFSLELVDSVILVLEQCH